LLWNASLIFFFAFLSPSYVILSFFFVIFFLTQETSLAVYSMNRIFIQSFLKILRVFCLNFMFFYRCQLDNFDCFNNLLFPENKQSVFSEFEKSFITILFVIERKTLIILFNSYQKFVIGIAVDE
jgi:hypothetical protein